MRFIAVFLLVFSSSCFAAEPQAASAPNTPLPDVSAAEAFSNGVTAFQKNDFPTARNWLRASLSKEPNQLVAWYDLGICEQRLGNKGLATAYFRKALFLKPRLTEAATALAYTRKSLEKSDIPHEVEPWETLRSSVLIVTSVYQFAFLTLILFFIASWLLLLYVGHRRRSQLDEKPSPPFPFAGALTAVLFAVFFILSICKLIDDQDLRATVITKKIEAKALPDESSTALFDLYEGLEVIVQQTRQGWAQVTFPGGATGWVPRASIFTTAERIN